MALEKPRIVNIAKTAGQPFVPLVPVNNQQYLNRLRGIYVVPGEDTKIQIVVTGSPAEGTGPITVAAGTPFTFFIDDWRAGGFCISSKRGVGMTLLCLASLNGWVVMTDEQ